QGPACGIDQQDLGLHPGQLHAANQPARLFGELQVQANHVGSAQELFEGDELDPQRLGPLGRGMKRPRSYLHADGAAEPGGLRSDRTGTDEAERLAAEIKVVPTRPAATLELI